MQDSIYHSTTKSFYREYIRAIVDKTKTAPEILSTFREHKMIPQKFATVTARELSNDEELCTELVHALRARMEPESPRFPYANYKKERAQELIGDLTEIYRGSIIAEDAKASVVIGSWPDNRNTEDARLNSQIFNYRIEAAIVPFEDTERSSVIIANINSVPGLDFGESYFEAGSYYVKTKEGSIYPCVRSIRGILSCCGFDNTGGGWKKRPCLVYIDLITPCPNWQGSAGKTHIDLTPYQETIGLVVSALANKMPSVRLNPGSSLVHGSAAEREGLYMDKYLKPFLIERRRVVEADPSLKIRDRMNQSTV